MSESTTLRSDLAKLNDESALDDEQGPKSNEEEEE